MRQNRQTSARYNRGSLEQTSRVARAEDCQTFGGHGLKTPVRNRRFSAIHIQATIAPGLVPSDCMTDDGDAATSRDEFVALAGKAAVPEATKAGQTR